MTVTFDPAITFESYYYLPYVKYRNLRAYASIDKYAEVHAEQTAPSAQSNQNIQNSQGTQTAQSNQNIQNNPGIQNDPGIQKSEITRDYNSLIEELKLYLPENKAAILGLIPYTELIQFLHLLNKDQLLNGLQLFTKEKLLQFISNIPKEDLLKILFKLFTSKEQLLEMLPIKELNRFLSSKKIAKTDILKIFQALSRTELMQIAEASTGITQGNKSHVQLLKILDGLKTSQLLDGIKGLEYKKMRNIISEMLKLNPSLYSEFNQNALFEQTLNFPKTSLIAGMGILDESQLINMLTELPQSFLAIVISQMDTELLSQLFVNDYQNLLSSLIS